LLLILKILFKYKDQDIKVKCWKIIISYENTSNKKTGEIMLILDKVNRIQTKIKKYI
jgi:hypothetical protein